MTGANDNARHYGLDHHGLMNLAETHWNLSAPALVEHAVQRDEGRLAYPGNLAVQTGKHTGRSAKDKFIVREPSTEGEIWWGQVNQPLDPDQFERLRLRILSYFQSRPAYVKDMAAGQDYRFPIRVVTEKAWHSLFAHNMFLSVPRDTLPEHAPEFTILHAPGLQAQPETDGTRTPTFIVVNLANKVALIGGTGYAGEIKKTIFTVLNYWLPRRDVLSMHCSANLGEEGDAALFFGLSGTGKTTLSAVPDRRLIGDDEHGWGEEGIFNFEGGCYAKMIRLDRENEPIIWDATRCFGSVMENVVISSKTRQPDFDDDSLTENTRGAYPISHVPNHVPDGRAGHPEHIFFLTADAFGVLPPIAKLNREQTMYYFLSGYTSKLAGTEKGLGDEPEATFSACFAAPFLPLPPRKYARLLGDKVESHDTTVWLVNTGWTGGPFGKGARIDLPYTRAMVGAALDGRLDSVRRKEDPIFGLQMPTSCPGVPDDLLDPKATWSDPQAYDRRANELAQSFADNFAQYKSSVDESVMRAGPKRMA